MKGEQTSNDHKMNKVDENAGQVHLKTPIPLDNAALKVTVIWNGKHLIFDIKYDVLKCNEMTIAFTHGYRHQFSIEGTWITFSLCLIKII